MSWVHVWAHFFTRFWGQGWPIDEPELDPCESYLLGGRWGGKRERGPVWLTGAPRWIRDHSPKGVTLKSCGWASLRHEATWRKVKSPKSESGSDASICGCLKSGLRNREPGRLSLCGPLYPRGDPDVFKQENDTPNWWKMDWGGGKSRTREMNQEAGAITWSEVR